LQKAGVFVNAGHFYPMLLMAGKEPTQVSPSCPMPV